MGKSQYSGLLRMSYSCYTKVSSFNMLNKFDITPFGIQGIE